MHRTCDTVMTKIGRETRLIGYDNDINIHRREAGKPPIYRIVRPRTITYAAMIRSRRRDHALCDADADAARHQRAA